MNDVSYCSSSIPPTNRDFSISTKAQVSELHGERIVSIFAALKLLGLERIQHLCASKLIKGIADDDIRNLITQVGWHDDEVNIDWLLDLNEAGVSKIQKIMTTLESLKEFVFACLTHKKERWNFRIRVFKDDGESGLCVGREIYISENVLVLSEDFRVFRTKSILLNEKELLTLFSEDLDLLNLTRVHESHLRDVLSVKIAEANKSDLSFTDGSELKFLFEHIRNLDKDNQTRFVKENFGFVIQLILHSFTTGMRLEEQAQQDAVALYQLYMTGSFCTRKNKGVVKFSEDKKTASSVITSTNLNCSIKEDDVPMLHRDVQGQLFKYLRSINDQWSLARASKANHYDYLTFCKSNLKKELAVETLKRSGFSEIQIYVQHPHLRESRQAERNLLALDVLGPNAMEKIENGLLSKENAKKIVMDFNEETSKWQDYARGPERYRRDGILPEVDIQKMTLLEKSCLDTRLAQFTINSGQLEIKQVIKAVKRLGTVSLDDRFFVSLRVHHFDNWDIKTACDNLLSLFALSKLTVDRYLKLNDRQIMFITLDALSRRIEQNQMTVESALFLLELIDEYKRSGWIGLNRLIAPTINPQFDRQVELKLLTQPSPHAFFKQCADKDANC